MTRFRFILKLSPKAQYLSLSLCCVIYLKWFSGPPNHPPRMPLRGSSEPNSRTTVLACYATCNHTHGEDVGLSGSRSNKQTPWLKAWTRSSMTSHSVIYVRFSRLLFLQQQQQQREALSVRPTGTKTGSEWKKKDGATGRRENESIHHGPRRWHLCSLWRDAMHFNMKLWWGGEKKRPFSPFTANLMKSWPVLPHLTLQGNAKRWALGQWFQVWWRASGKTSFDKN